MNQETAIQLALEGHNIFLTGNAGTGKTYTLNKIIEQLRNNGKSVAVTASTGIASTHINGKTIHSWAGIGIKEKLEIDDFYKIQNNKFSRNRIFFSDVLIIDEISMLHDYRLDFVEQVCRFIKDKNKIFGGIQVIVCGDFFQLPPVNKNGKKNYCFNAASWKQSDFKVCYLQKIYRQTDKTFIDILNNIRRNSVTAEQKNILSSLKQNTKNLKKSVNLFCKNNNVDILNATELSKIKTESFIFKMESDGLDWQVQALKKNCLAADTLILKEKAKVMIIINDFKKKYCKRNIGRNSKS